MRWLFLFVLIVNVVYVSWEYSQLTDESTVQTANNDIPGIELLSEIGQATKNPTQTSTVAVSKVSEPSQRSAGDAKPAASMAQQTPAATSVVTKLGADRCYTLGPFRELDNLREFTRAIKDYVIAASFRSREEKEQSMFWIYLEPSASLAEARALGKRLESKKIKDYYVISGGPQDKGVSLGHFKAKDRAYALADRVREMDFKPVVEPVFRSYTIYWLDYEVPASKVIPQKIFTRHLPKKINRLDRSCF